MVLNGITAAFLCLWFYVCFLFSFSDDALKYEDGNCHGYNNKG